jgi:transcriptional regulator with XRE-family HTH domain
MFSKIPLRLVGHLSCEPRWGWEKGRRTYSRFDFLVDHSSSPLPGGERHIFCSVRGEKHRAIYWDCRRGTELMVQGVLVVECCQDENGINISTIMGFDIDKYSFLRAQSKPFRMLNRIKRGWPVRLPLLDLWHWFKMPWRSLKWKWHALCYRYSKYLPMDQRSDDEPPPEPVRLMLAKFIELARRERNQSPQELAARAGVDLGDVRALEDPKWPSPSAQVIESVAAVLDVDALPLLELGGLIRAENKALDELAVEFAARLEGKRLLKPQELEALSWLRIHAFKSRPKRAEVG